MATPKPLNKFLRELRGRGEGGGAFFMGGLLLAGAWHRRRIAGGMADVVNDDFVVGHFVEHQITIGGNNQTADGWIVGARTNQRMRRQQADKGFDARVNPRRPCGERGAR
jgi:hypothetical protein